MSARTRYATTQGTSTIPALNTDSPRLSVFDGSWLLLFALVLFVTMIYHELGHDEAQAWNIARAAAGPLDVIWHGRYEGHTPFWHGVLWPFTRLGNPVWMQAISLLMGIIVGTLLLRDKPFNRWVCLLVLFGYFIAYEYPIVPRPYILALTLSALLASHLRHQGHSFWYLSLLCGLIAFTSAYGVALSVAFMVMVSYECSSVATGKAASRGELAIGIFIFGGLLLLAIGFILLPLDRGIEYEILSGQEFNIAQLPITMMTPTFPHLDRLPMGIGSWIMSTPWAKFALTSATFATMLGVAIWLSDRPAALTGWLVALLVLPMAMLLSGRISERHLGHLFLAALVMAWARPGLTSVTQWAGWRQWPSQIVMPLSRIVSRRLAGIGLCVVLAYHCLVTAGAASLDIRHSQSPWLQISRFLKSNIQGDYVILTDTVYRIGPVLSYLDMEAFDTNCKCWTRYKLWTGKQFPEPEATEKEWCRLSRQGKNVIALLAMTNWTMPNWSPDERHQLIAEFPSGYRDTRIPPPRLYRLNKPADEVCP